MQLKRLEADLMAGQAHDLCVLLEEMDELRPIEVTDDGDCFPASVAWGHRDGEGGAAAARTRAAAVRAAMADTVRLAARRHLYASFCAKRWERSPPPYLSAL